MPLLAPTATARGSICCGKLHVKPKLDHVVGLQAFDDGEVCAVGAHGHVEHFHPEAAVRGIASAGVRGIARIIRADVTREILRGVADREGFYVRGRTLTYRRSGRSAWR